MPTELHQISVSLLRHLVTHLVQIGPALIQAFYNVPHVVRMAAVMFSFRLSISILCGCLYSIPGIYQVVGASLYLSILAGTWFFNMLAKVDQVSMKDLHA